MDNDVLLKLANQLGAALIARKNRLTLAESCTGGMASQYVTAVAGSSSWFDCAFITYSNQAKISMLGVSESTLETYGAVSEQIAAEMALGALNNSSADIAGSITGIAGPDGGTKDKSLGTVCFAFAFKHHAKHVSETIRHTQHFVGNREKIRKQSVEYALKQLLMLTLSSEL